MATKKIVLGSFLVLFPPIAVIIYVVVKFDIGWQVLQPLVLAIAFAAIMGFGVYLVTSDGK